MSGELYEGSYIGGFIWGAIQSAERELYGELHARRYGG